MSELILPMCPARDEPCYPCIGEKATHKIGEELPAEQAGRFGKYPFTVEGEKGLGLRWASMRTPNL